MQSTEPDTLRGCTVVSLAPNLPGPAAAMRLAELGASVTKIEPPAGDFMATAAPNYYAELTRGQTIKTVDLKSDSGYESLFAALGQADVLLTSSRPSALDKLGLAWAALHERFPRLIHVAIVGYPGERAEVAGHDLTYQAANGTLDPGSMPRILAADLAGAERAVSATLAALLRRSVTGEGEHVEVALSDAAAFVAGPARHGLTVPGGVLGGALPQYGTYLSADGYVAVAALEPHFWQRLRDALDLPESGEGLAAALARRTSDEWEEWAAQRDIPIAAVR